MKVGRAKNAAALRLLGSCTQPGFDVGALCALSHIVPGSSQILQHLADHCPNIGEAEAPNAIMGWTVFQPRREQWTRQRYQLAPPERLAQPPAIRDSARYRACA